jgi:nucleoside-diphosphate-sugar epimerase
MTKILISGAAGLVGQNLVLLLQEAGYRDLIAIDKQEANLSLLKGLNPNVETVCADLAEEGSWKTTLKGVDILVMLHAQITGKTRIPFDRNNIVATRQILDAARSAGVRYVVHVSSSVVNSVADDDYTQTKKIQEQIFRDSGLPGAVLRPTLMYGWFDPKHFGWLARFMERVPVFPIPGHGRYMRQPLYNRDFCRAILWCVKNQPIGRTFDVVGQERVDYIDIIREIRRVKNLRTPIIKIPYWLFYGLLKFYALFSEKPPFTASQLKALTAGDDFSGVNISDTFGFKPMTLHEALEETFCHPVYSKYVVERAQ